MNFVMLSSAVVHENCLLSGNNFGYDMNYYLIKIEIYSKVCGMDIIENREQRSKV